MGRRYPWVSIVDELRARPTRPKLFPSMVGVPVSLVERIRHRKVRALRLDDGKIHAYIATRTTLDDGREIADVWLSFKPHPHERNDQ